MLYFSVMTMLLALLYLVFAYSLGSLPFSIWVTRRVKGVDVREAGSGHATTTNTIRQAGFGWGALVLILDLAKGFLPTYLALHAGGRDALPSYVVPLTAACAVIGHCWPVFAQFRGGMGLATFGGALLAIDWLAFVLGLAVLLSLTLSLRHSARAGALAGLLLAPVVGYFHLGSMAVGTALAGGLVVGFRFLSDWNRTYRELWLDREGRS